MLTARNLIVGVIVIGVISLAWNIYSLTRPPDRNGMGQDTYGTWPQGMRGAYELLSELKIPVERRLGPPNAALPSDATLVLWNSSTLMVAQEPAHLAGVRKWLEAGGRVVVTPTGVESNGVLSILSQVAHGPTQKSLAELLGGPVIEFKDADSNESLAGNSVEATERRPDTDPLRKESRGSQPQEKDLANVGDRKRALDELGALRKDVERMSRELMGHRELTPPQRVKVSGTGTFQQIAAGVETLQLRQHELQVLESVPAGATGQLTFTDREDRPQTIAASFNVGRGELVVVATGELVQNQFLSQQDNSVLLARLLVGSRQRVIFDEFYHGLAVRGNALWLVTRPGYGITSLALLLLIVVLFWRQAVSLGPPQPERPILRRSIGEYVHAMGAFLNRGKPSRGFLLKEIRQGALNTVRRELGLPPGRDDVEEIANVLRRRHPARAQLLVDAVQAIDQALHSTSTIQEAELIRLMQGVSRCL